MSDSLRSSSTLTEPLPKRPHHFKLVLSKSLITNEVLHHRYRGKGTEEDPFSVEFIPHDPRNPMTFGTFKKWWITVLLGIATLAVAFNSSAYSGGIQQVIETFDASEEQTVLGVSLFVLGFAIGPLLWAPLSEIYGRQIWFIITYGIMTAFNCGAAASPNIQTLLVLRFFAGAFGSSPLTNAGGVIADMFPPKQRGLAMTLFSITPFMGPCLGPIIGGFIAQNPSAGFRWLLGVIAIFSGVVWIIGVLLIPETYAPVILRARAADLSRITGKVYVSKLDIGKGEPKLSKALKTALSRPWLLLFREPVVMITSIYMAIVYGTLYMLFAAYPIVYQEARGWSQGIGGLAFLGVLVGFLASVLYIVPDNKRFGRLEDEAIARGEPGAPPEARLFPAMVGAVLIPIGQFWFAWTNDPSLPWAPSVVSGLPFGMGMVLVFLSIFNYLIDSYTVYAASVLAANTILRSLFGVAFPLFTSYMYDNLGIHWASSIPAFLSLICVPAPFIFYKMGATIRRKQKYSKEAMEIMEEIRTAEHANEEGEETDDNELGSSEYHENLSEKDRNESRHSQRGQPIKAPEKHLKHNRESLIGDDENVDLERGVVS